MADNKKIFSQHMKECIEDCATKAKAVGLGRAEYLLQRLAEMLDEGGGSGGGDIVILKELMPETSFDAGTNYYRFQSSFNLYSGKTYQVTFDGDLYELVAYICEYNVAVIGNGDPFTIDGAGIYVNTTGKHTISVKVKEIYDSLIPSNVVRVKLTKGENFSYSEPVYTIDATYNELEQLVNEGKQVYISGIYTTYDSGAYSNNYVNFTFGGFGYNCIYFVSHTIKNGYVVPFGIAIYKDESIVPDYTTAPAE